MYKTALFSGIVSIILAGVIFLFAEGPRRFYTGIFFLLIGIVMLVSAYRLRKRGDT